MVIGLLMNLYNKFCLCLYYKFFFKMRYFYFIVKYCIRLKRRCKCIYFFYYFLYKKEKDLIFIGDDYELDSEVCYNDKYVIMVIKKYIKIIIDKVILCYII